MTAATHHMQSAPSSSHCSTPSERPQSSMVNSDTDAAGESKRYNIPEGLSRTQKRNLKKSIREKEKKALGKTPSDAFRYPEDPLENERKALLLHVQGQLSELRPLAEMTAVDVLANYEGQQRALHSMCDVLNSALDRLSNKVKRPANRRLTPAQQLKQIQEFSELPDNSQVSLEQLEEQLLITICWDNAKCFQQNVADLRKVVEDRIQMNDKYINSARDYDRLTQVANRIALMKKGRNEDVLVVPNNLKRVTVEVPGDVSSLLLPPTNLARRVERIFTTSIERPNDRSRQRGGFVIVGLPEDVSRTVHFLKNADFSGNHRVTLTNRAMAGFMGRAGAGVRHLEDTMSCLFNKQDNNEVIVYGLKDETEKALERLRRINAESLTAGPAGNTSRLSSVSPAPSDSGTRSPNQRHGGSSPAAATEIVPVPHPAVARSLTGRFLKRLREIEAKHSRGDGNISCRVSLLSAGAGAPSETFGADLSGDATSPQSSAGPSTPPSGPRLSTSGIVTIRGRPNTAVVATKRALEDLLKDLAVIQLVPRTPEALHQLFSTRSSGFGARSGPGRRVGAAAAAEAFRLLMDATDNVAFIKHDGNLVLVGSPNALEAVKVRALELLEQAAQRSIRIPIPSHIHYRFSSDGLEDITAATGVAIRRITSTRAGFLPGKDKTKEVNEASAMLPKTGEAATSSIFVEISGTEEELSAAQKIISQIVENEAEIEVVPIEDSAVMTELIREARERIRAIEVACGKGTRITLDRAKMTCTIIGSREAVTRAHKEIQSLCDDITKRNAALDTCRIPLASASAIRHIIGHRGATINGIRETSGARSVEIHEDELAVVIRGTPEACSIAEGMVRDILNQKEGSGIRSGMGAPTAQRHKASDAASAPLKTSAPNATDGGAFPTLGEAAQLPRQTKRGQRRRVPQVDAGAKDRRSHMSVDAKGTDVPVQKDKNEAESSIQLDESGISGSDAAASLSEPDNTTVEKPEAAADTSSPTSSQDDDVQDNPIIEDEDSD